MAEFQILALDDITVPERLRAVEEAHAQAIMLSIARHGLINPVSVRRTPNGQAKYTLVSGAHRLKAVELLGNSTIDAIIVEADKVEAQLKEVAENLFRNELSAIDRAVFVGTYRDLWQQRNGAINPKGGRPKKQGQVGPVSDPSPLDLIEADAADGFNSHLAARLGVAASTIKRLNLIAQLPRPLREQLRGRPEADNQSFLLSLAKLDAARDGTLTRAIDLAKGDVKLALEAITPPKPKPSRDDAAFAKLVEAWGRTNQAVRLRFLDHMRQRGDI